MNDRNRILKMLEDKKINSDEAIKLLDALENKNVDDSHKHKEDEFFKIESTKEKMLYIRVKSNTGDKVRINLPIEFIKIMGGVIPNANLEKYDIDIEKILKAIDSGFTGRMVEIESEDGDKVIIEIC